MDLNTLTIHGIPYLYYTDSPIGKYLDLWKSMPTVKPFAKNYPIAKLDEILSSKAVVAPLATSSVSVDVEKFGVYRLVSVRYSSGSTSVSFDNSSSLCHENEVNETVVRFIDEIAKRLGWPSSLPPSEIFVIRNSGSKEIYWSKDLQLDVGGVKVPIVPSGPATLVDLTGYGAIEVETKATSVQIDGKPSKTNVGMVYRAGFHTVKSDSSQKAVFLKPGAGIFVEFGEPLSGKFKPGEVVYRTDTDSTEVGCSGNWIVFDTKGKLMAFDPSASVLERAVGTHGISLRDTGAIVTDLGYVINGSFEPFNVDPAVSYEGDLYLFNFNAMRLVTKDDHFTDIPSKIQGVPVEAKKSGSTVVIIDSYSNVRAYSAVGRNLLWSVHPMETVNGMAIDDGIVYLWNSRRIVELNVKNGKTVKTVETSGTTDIVPFSGTVAILSNGKVTVDGKIIASATRTVSDGKILYGTGDGKLWSFDGILKVLKQTKDVIGLKFCDGFLVIVHNDYLEVVAV